VSPLLDEGERFVKRQKKQKKVPVSGEKNASFGTSFGDLLKDSGLAVKPSKKKKIEPPPPPPEPAPKTVEGFDFSLNGKITISREKKRRGGKTVTLVRGLELDEEELMALSHELRKTMGCGSSLEDDALVLQGDQRVRLEKWLLGKGAKQVVVA
jgi:translation initiation factor 1